MSDLYRRLVNLDGKSYGSYKSLRGSHPLPEPPARSPQGHHRADPTPRLGATLFIDKVQSDPFAPPSRARVTIPLTALRYRGSSRSHPGHFSTAELDLLNRRLAESFTRIARGIAIDSPGQQVLRRTAVTELKAPAQGVDKRQRNHGGALQICLEIHLPARGRRILGREAARLICEKLPLALIDAVVNAPATQLDAAAELEHDQQILRREADAAGLIGFIANGSVLPRKAGNSQLPKPGATGFVAPASLTHEFELPSGRRVSGMGIPRGVTLIVGGGYHGKSTLLSALVTGVYNHIAGDGREFAIADRTAVALRAEDGRAITDVNISPFINDLPSGEDTSHFTTENASGSTSQAAGLMEALAAGTQVLLIDEDTSATNFMIRDNRMRALVPDEREPITPLVARVRELWENHGVSTVIVAGGSGAFIDVADTVIAMDAYVPHDVTERARQLRTAGEPNADIRVIDPSTGAASPAVAAAPTAVFTEVGGRFPTVDGYPSGNDRRHKPPRSRGLELIQVGRDNVDLRAISQIVDDSQTETIARILHRVAQRLDGKTDLQTLIAEEHRAFLQAQFSAGQEFPHTGRLAEPRITEVTAAINRLRALRPGR